MHLHPTREVSTHMLFMNRDLDGAFLHLPFKQDMKQWEDCAAAHCSYSPLLFWKKALKRKRKVVINYLLAGLCEGLGGDSILGTSVLGQPHYSGLNLSLWFQSELILFTLKLLRAAADVHS